MKYIGAKIGIGYAIAFLLLASIGIVSYLSLGNLSESISWVDHTNQVLRELVHINKDLVDAETGQRGFLLTGKESYLEPYLSGIEKVYADIEQLQQLTADNPQQQQRIAKLLPQVDAKLAELQETIELRKSAGFDGALQVVLEDRGKRVMDTIRQLLDDMDLEEKNLLKVRMAEQVADVRQTKTIIIAGLLIGSIILLVAAYLITNDIAKPIKHLTSVAQIISDGNTGVVVEGGVRTDEVGLLARAFERMVHYLKEMASVAERIAENDLSGTVSVRGENDILGQSLQTMLESLRSQINNVLESVQTLNSATKEITAATAQFSASASQTSTSVSETSTSVEQTRQIADMVSKKTEEVSSGAQNLVKVSENGKKATEDTIRAMESIQEQIGQIADSIVGLSEQTQTIGDIINTVEDLSEQSNLLAVNASIEAAKVGEHGKGFAVVALEIKNLAEQSKESTGRVRNILTEIQKAAGASVMVTEQGAKAVDSGVQQSFVAGEAIMSMTSGIVQSAQAASQIMASSRQQITGMDQIVQAMQSIEQASRQNATGAVQLQDSARGLEEMSRSLSDIVARYRLR